MGEPRFARILGTGSYLPKHRLDAAQLNARLKREPGWVERRFGIVCRRYALEESTLEMAVAAARDAMSAAGTTDVDCIISAASVPQQAVPTTAVLVQQALGLHKRGLAAFDVNSTCLSFLTALDLATHLLHLGSYQRILIVSSEKPSLGLDWSDGETSALFGDGAAAAVVGRGDGDSCCLGSLTRTYAIGAGYCQVRGGGTIHEARPEANDSFFRMKGRAAYRLTAAKLPALLDDLLAGLHLKLDQIKLLVPHQASGPGMAHMAQQLGLAEGQVVDIFATHGNQVAASIPTALHHAIERGVLLRGDTFMLVGTAAGISLGAMVLRY